MGEFFATMFEVVRQEQSLIKVLSLTDPDLMKRSKLTDLEKNIVNNLALEKTHRQRRIREYIALRIIG